MIKITHKGNFSKTYKFLKRASQADFFSKLDAYGKEGVSALSAATPVDTGKTAASWNYEIHKEKGSVTITWTNSNVVNGISVALLIQYGHGTRNGAYVQGRDFINPAMQPIFDKIAKEAWREVTKL